MFNFTKRVIKLYGLTLVEESDNVFGSVDVKEELKIKTHYESLDIAGCNKIHYLKFSLPGEIINLDEQLQEITRNEEQTD